MAQGDLIASVLQLADGDPSLTDEARLIILAALDSDESLDNLLGGRGQTLAEIAAAVDEPSPAIGAYLKSVTVAGFKGIGQRLTIKLNPGPGLTVIAGRNGSGKSSIAEALEMALTGSSYRWAKQSSSVWTANWRNLHETVPAEIRVELAEEGRGVTTIGLDWSSLAGLMEGTSWVQHLREGRQLGRDSLGWSGPLDLYRPLLSYDEVGGVLEGRPSDLFDKLHLLLGLEPITDGQRRLTATLKRLQVPAALVKTALVDIKADLTRSADPRAASALALLAKRSPNTGAIRQLVTGSVVVENGLEILRKISHLHSPERSAVEFAAVELKESVNDLASRAGSVAPLLADRSHLLAEALTLHKDHGDMDCPICGTGHLNADWADRAQRSLTTEQSVFADLHKARRRLDAAHKRARLLIDSIEVPPITEDEELTSSAPANSAFSVWAAAPSGDLELADHLLSSIDPLATAFAALRDEASRLVTARDDLWAPLAMSLGDWLRLKLDADTSAPQIVQIKIAADWLKVRAGDLRNQRLTPLGDRARHIWAQLRQESSVDLGAIRLEGQATSRHVELSAQVDGVDAGALSVMSQGELHALALALFLPRATAPDSPFRFILLDDPIQAMDPAKVEGFVRVLQELAIDRQVIVLTHDDRLASAVRRTKIMAQIYEVTRSVGSRVTVSESMHPASRYLDDAFALAADDGVPNPVKDRVVPELCRWALEAAAFEVFESKRISEGAAHAVVEQQWAESPRLRQRIALAVHGDKGVEITRWLSFGRRAESLDVCNRAVHSGSDRDYREDVRAVRATVKELRLSK